MLDYDTTFDGNLTTSATSTSSTVAYNASTTSITLTLPTYTSNYYFITEVNYKAPPELSLIHKIWLNYPEFARYGLRALTDDECSIENSYVKRCKLYLDANFNVRLKSRGKVMYGMNRRVFL